jgi:HlyD family secretion protein
MCLKSIQPLFLALCLFMACGRQPEGKNYTGILEGKVVEVPAMVGGKILDLRVDEGERILEGDTLAIIDATELYYQNKQLQAAYRELVIQEQTLNTALEQAQKDLNYIQEKHERTKNLVKNQAMPQQNLDDVTNQLEHVRSVYLTTKQNVQTLLAKKEQHVAQIQIIKKKNSDAVITAPESGIVFTKYFEKGEAIPPMAALVEIIFLDTIHVKIYVSEKMIPKIVYGQEVKIRVDGLNYTLPGIVSWISPKAEFTPKTVLTREVRTSLVYAVKIKVPNPDGLLKHGMPVEVIL